MKPKTNGGHIIHIVCMYVCTYIYPYESINAMRKVTSEFTCVYAYTRKKHIYSKYAKNIQKIQEAYESEQGKVMV